MFSWTVYFVFLRSELFFSLFKLHWSECWNVTDVTLFFNFFITLLLYSYYVFKAVFCRNIDTWGTGEFGECCLFANSYANLRIYLTDKRVAFFRPLRKVWEVAIAVHTGHNARYNILPQVVLSDCCDIRPWVHFGRVFGVSICLL